MRNLKQKLEVVKQEFFGVISQICIQVSIQKNVHIIYFFCFAHSEMKKNY